MSKKNTVVVVNKALPEKKQFGVKLTDRKYTGKENAEVPKTGLDIRRAMVTIKR